MTSIHHTSTERKRVTSIFTSGKVSATMVIPIETARKYRLEEGTHVILQETPEGILLRRLDI